MILTPNIAIDNTHSNAFKEEFKKYKNCKIEASKHWGTGKYEHENLTIEIKKIRTLQGNGLYMAVTNKNDCILICKLISAPIPQGVLPWGRKIYVMDSIRVNEKYIGRGFAPMIYNWLADNGYTIISDSHQNVNSLAVWHKLGRSGGVFTINLEDGTRRVYNPLTVEDWMLFGNNDLKRYWPVRFVLPARN